MKKTSLILAVLLLASIILGYFLLQKTSKEPTELLVTGTFETTEVPVGFKIAGRLEKRLVDEGVMVSIGQVIAQLETDELQQTVMIRKSELDEAKATLLELTNGYLPEEIAQAVARLNQTTAELERVQVDAKRQKELFSKKVITSREEETSESTLLIAEAKAIEAKEALKLLQNGIRPERIAQARAKVAQTEASLTLASIQLRDATLKAPLSGFVLSKSAEAGEVLNAGAPVVTIGELTALWLRAYINETDLGRVKLGQKVRITTDTYPGKVYEGHISFISSEAEFTPKTIQTAKERVKLVYRIKIDVANPTLELKPGMLADAIIFTTHGFALSLDQKVGQLLMVHFHGTTYNDEAKKLIQEAHVGGFIYYNWANGLESPLQVHALSKSLQEASEIPLFISIDQEGGRVNRLNEGFTKFPSQAAIGATKNPKLAYDMALTIGQELLSVGINMNLAPVVDINSNPHIQVIGDRSFGSTPQEVVSFAKEALKGYQESGIIAVMKHFPGHGEASADSHESLPIVAKSKEALEAIELYPYRHLQPPAIMTAHLMLPAWDANICVTLSPIIVSTLLQDYKGLIITDSLVMQGLLDACPSLPEAAIRALEAGHDILLLGGKQMIGSHGHEITAADVIHIHHAIVEAVHSGRLSEARIDASIEKILKLKSR